MHVKVFGKLEPYYCLWHVDQWYWHPLEPVRKTGFQVPLQKYWIWIYHWTRSPDYSHTHTHTLRRSEYRHFFWKLHVCQGTQWTGRIQGPIFTSPGFFLMLLIPCVLFTLRTLGVRKYTPAPYFISLLEDRNLPQQSYAGKLSPYKSQASYKLGLHGHGWSYIPFQLNIPYSKSSIYHF